MLQLGINLLITIRASVRYSKQDIWISFILAGLAGLFITFVVVSVSLRFPRKSLIEYSVTILGTGLGKAVGLLYILMWIWVTGIILREGYNFIRIGMLFRTPPWVIVGTLTVLVVFTVYRGGIEGIGRISEMWGPFLLVILIITYVLTISNLDRNMLLPVYADTGITRITAGALAPASLLGESVLSMMLIPFIDKAGKKTRTALMLALCVSSFLLLVGAIWVVMTFGPVVADKFTYPFFEMVKLIYLMEFIQNLDILIISIWLVSVFIKLSVYLFITSHAVAQWFGKPDQWKRAIGGVAALTFALCMTVIRINPPTNILLEQIWIKYVLPVNMVAIPLLLWSVSAARGLKENHPESKKSPDIK